MGSPSTTADSAVNTVTDTPKLDSFTCFPKLPQEMKDKIWENSISTPGIHFFQHYDSINRTGKKRPKTLPDAYSTSTHIARLMLTCRDSKATVERIRNGPKSIKPYTIKLDTSNERSTQQAQVYLEHDIICFGSLHQGDDNVANLPLDRGAFNRPRTSYTVDILAPNGTRAKFNDDWSQIRRVGISYPLEEDSAEAIALVGEYEHGGNHHAGSACYYCMAFHLSFLQRLEVVYIIVPEIPKPVDQCPKQKYRVEMTQDDGFDMAAVEVEDSDDEDDQNNDDEGGEESEDDEADKDKEDGSPDELKPLETFQGAKFQYYEVTKCPEISEALHWMSHLTMCFDENDHHRHDLRHPRVKFKILSWSE